MKKWLFTVLLLSSVQLLHADDILKNSDFTDGALNWHGDGKAPGELKSPDALDNTPSPYGDKGLVIVLNPHKWTKIVQEFKTRNSSVGLNVTYKLAPDTVFSIKDEDYAKIPEKIDFNGWQSFNGKRGGWMVMLSDFGKSRIFSFSIVPTPGSLDQPAVTSTFNALDPEDEKTLCLAFPPGTGAVILTHVSLDSN